MRKKTMKTAFLAAMAGTLLQFGGCLGFLFQQAPIETAAEQIAGLVQDPGLGG